MTKSMLHVVAGLSACASSASGQIFDVRSASTVSPNSPITASADFFQSTVSGAGFRPPSIELLESVIADPNDAPEYDSYVAIDCGPSVGGDPNVKGDGFHANPGDLAFVGGDPFAVPNQVHGIWFMDPSSARPEVPACPNILFGGRDAVFLGRLSFRSTSGDFPNQTIALGANGITLDIRDPGTTSVGSPATDSLLVRFTAFGVGVHTGQDGGDLSVHALQGTYELREVISTAGPLPGGTARWQIHDLYVVEVPAPGMPALFGLAGALLRRRGRGSS